jgi:hypothetical protein
MSLSSIRTWGWFPTSAGGAGSDASISSIRTWGWLFDETGPSPETPVAVIFSLPIETLLSLSNNFDLPIENIGGVSINAINNLPIENTSNIQLLNNIPISNLRDIPTVIGELPISHLEGLSQNRDIPTEVISSLNIGNDLPVSFLGTTIINNIFNLPIEYNQGIAAFTTQQLPIEIIGRIVNDFDLPIEVIGATLAWILDDRGTLWRVPARSNEWVRVGQVNMEWIVDERGPSC